MECFELQPNKNSIWRIPFPSFVGLAVIVKQAVLLALDLRSSKPSQGFRPSGISWIRSPLQWRDRAGFSPVFSIKPFRAPVSFIQF